MRHWVRGHRHRVRRVDARVSGTTVARRQYRTERETRIHADLYTYHCTRLRKHIAHMNTWSGMNGGSIQRRGAFHTGASQSCGGRPHGGREAARDGGGQRRRWHRRRRRCHRRAHERTQRLLRRGLRHSVSGGPPLRRVNNFGSFVFFFFHLCIQMQQSWTKRKTKEQHSGGRREQSCQTDIPEACAWRRKLQAQVVPSVVQCHLEYEVTLLKGEAKHTRPVYQMKIG